MEVERVVVEKEEEDRAVVMLAQNPIFKCVRDMADVHARTLPMCPLCVSMSRMIFILFFF